MSVFCFGEDAGLAEGIVRRSALGRVGQFEGVVVMRTRMAGLEDC